MGMRVSQGWVSLSFEGARLLSRSLTQRWIFVVYKRSNLLLKTRKISELSNVKMSQLFLPLTSLSGWIWSCPRRLEYSRKSDVLCCCHWLQTGINKGHWWLNAPLSGEPCQVMYSYTTCEYCDTGTVSHDINYRPHQQCGWSTAFLSKPCI